MINIIAVNLVH